ncbi:bifunctional diguanylate cyclase/phosphodiesterase [Butyrivibrio hungatei]|uniref:GGDEF/EAL domain-containing protein n=1 Tax=Butyrivibrio hungatei TaxID=185008 RepID=A0A1D9P009_9FIRM|nr:bifunctional diguanylate cyclase/phosphodiesterase [Butyrivibrio hungatei]AOZ95811.1 GGDEF/EAL domain-containing protein [Butyrivibrio hungatei]
MNPDFIFGKNAYYYNREVEAEKILRLVNYGAQYEDNGLIILTQDKHCVYANKRAFSMLHSEDDLDMLYESFLNWMKDIGVAWDTPAWSRIYKVDDKERLFRVRYRQLLDDESMPAGHVYIIQNLSDVIENGMGEQYRLTHDELTHLYNKEGFFQETRKLLNANPDKDFLLIYSNIKDFKLINQLFGLEKGNAILMHIGELLAQRVMDDDVYGRINGDHFALVMPKERFSEKDFSLAVNELAGRIISTSYSIHIQIGIYEIVDPGMDISFMCDRAYMACKSIKRDNACEIAWYSDDMLVNALLEKEILSSFDFALFDQQFGIYLQPQIRANGEVYGAEALARWLHPENGVIEPEVFIKVLEKADLIYKLDKYVWELAARQLAAWKGTEWSKMSLSVNVSPKDLYYLDIKKEFTSLIEKYKIDPLHLNIELTETAVTSDVNKCAKLIAELRQSGFIVEIDDFGSGYSSLNMLKDINADVLKIDMGFLRRTDNHERAMVILRYTIDMAYELGMGVITEGVETKEQFEKLIEMGCEMFQGFYFDEPMPVEMFEKKYKR